MKKKGKWLTRRRSDNAGYGRFSCKAVEQGQSLLKARERCERGKGSKRLTRLSGSCSSITSSFCSFCSLCTSSSRSRSCCRGSSSSRSSASRCSVREEARKKNRVRGDQKKLPVHREKRNVRCLSCSSRSSRTRFCWSRRLFCRTTARTCNR